MIEKQPQIFSLAHAVLNAATSGPSSRHMMSGLVSIERPCSEYSGKTTRSIVGMPFRALVTKAQILFACAARSAFVTRSEEHTSELQSRLHLVCRLLLEKKK